MIYHVLIKNNKVLMFLTIVLVVSDLFIIPMQKSSYLYFIQFIFLIIIFITDYKCTFISSKTIKIRYALWFRNKSYQQSQIEGFILEYKYSGRESGVYLYLKGSNFKVLIKQWISYKETTKIIKSIGSDYRIDFKGVTLGDNKYIYH